jgi:hypothetical protein
MNRRSFFGRLTASIAGAIAATKLPPAEATVPPTTPEQMRVNVQLDGKEIARAVTPYMPVRVAQESGTIIGIALNRAVKKGDTVEVRLVSDGGVIHGNIVALTADDKIYTGDLVQHSHNLGRVKSFRTHPRSDKG